MHVSVAGELDLEGGDALEAAVAPILVPGGQLFIDLSRVVFADSSGLGALVAIERAALEAHADLTLLQPSARLRSILTLTGLTDYFRRIN